MNDSLPAVVDVTVSGGGTVYLFHLLTQEARAWVDEHVVGERHMLGTGLAVEHRYAGPLVTGMTSDGLIVRDAEDF